ncbi:hypothetical protein [Promicromonospora sp. NPDC050249]|uniref:hypothetical protein n=1 Tax=Promicromonospora sp. NPDC050249 TaxID=3154743 RepID=UPI0033F5C0FE
MNAKDESVEGGAHLAADLIMGQPHPGMDVVARATAVMDRRALDAHQQISGVDRHWQIAIHLWPALKSVTHHTGQISGHLLAAGVDADMLAGLGPHPHYPRDPQRHLVFHTPIPPTSQWPHNDLPVHELGAQNDPGRYDLVLANLPFHDVALFDPDRRARLGTYHQELLISALNQSTLGGITVALASPVFLDHPDPTLRQAADAKADLIGAVRLPSGAMRPGSNAEGPTDVLFLYHRQPGQAGPGIPPARDVITPSGRGHLNDYWLDNPEHVLGQLRPELNSATFTVAPRSEPLGNSLQVAFDQIATVMINGLRPRAPSYHAPETGPQQTSKSMAPAYTPDL